MKKYKIVVYAISKNEEKFVWEECYENCASCKFVGNSQNMGCISCKNNLFLTKIFEHKITQILQ